MDEKPPKILPVVPPELLDDGLSPEQRQALAECFAIPPLPPLIYAEPLFQEARLALHAWCSADEAERSAMQHQIARILIRDGVFVLNLGSALRFVSVPPLSPLSA